MYFVLSKMFWAVAAPTTVLVLLVAAGVLLLAAGRRRAGLWLAVPGIALLLLVGAVPVGSGLSRILEDRFPACVEPGRVDAVIVLGGAVDPFTMSQRGQLALTDAAERMIAMADIARRHPDWRVVFTGGSAALLDEGIGEAEAVAPYLGVLGIPEGRLLLEGKSRNTFENARFTADLLKPQKGQTFLLVTSALHMPRSVGLFRKAGFDVIACPVDYTTAKDMSEFRPSGRFSENFRKLDNAFREFVGLAAARLFGQSDAFFPAP